MNKLLIAVVGLCLLQSTLASEVEQEENSLSTVAPDFDFQPAQNFIASIYRRAMIQALQARVTELGTKLANGENAMPAAMEILKITLLSNPTQTTIKKAAEHVLNIMSPEIRKLASAAGIPEEVTTPMPKQQS